MVLIWVSLIICCHLPTLISNIYLTTISIECPLWQWNSQGKVLLNGKCPFVRTKNLSGQKTCLDKKLVRTKKLSGQKNCPDKKIVRTKQNFGQKNCLDKLFLSTLSMPLIFCCLFFSVHWAFDLLSWLIYVHIFSDS